MTKDVFDCIRERRSCRKFKDEFVPRATISRIIESGTWAANAGNIQPWKFIVVLNDQVKSRLAHASNQKWINGARVMIAVIADKSKSEKKFGERGSDLYCIQDTAAAMQNMMLAATALGLGCCWVGAFDESKVAEALEIKDNDLRPVAMLALGFPNAEPKASIREPLENVVTIIE
jgi:nitroreductase